MSDVASRERSAAARTPLAVPSCAACVGQRTHTPQEWKNHPLAGHGYSKETGYTHPDVIPALTPSNVKLGSQQTPPEAN
jgi:hypothetical protein